jgi:hypothetical protein
MERMIHYALPQNLDELNFMLGVIKNDRRAEPARGRVELRRQS